MIIITAGISWAPSKGQVLLALSALPMSDHLILTMVLAAWFCYNLHSTVGETEAGRTLLPRAAQPRQAEPRSGPSLWRWHSNDGHPLACLPASVPAERPDTCRLWLSSCIAGGRRMCGRAMAGLRCTVPVAPWRAPAKADFRSYKGQQGTEAPVCARSRLKSSKS